MDKKVSIIIPCFNVADYLEKSWKSLLDQTIGMESLECIFVNDASTDDGATLAKLKEIESVKPDSCIVIDLIENMGPGGARNVGLNYVSGKYLMFFDADDELREDTCELLYELAEENASDIIQFNHLFISNDQSRSSQSSRENKNYVIDTKEDRIPFLNATLVTYGCTNKFYRTGLIKEVNPHFPLKVRYEEPLFVYPLFLYAKRVYLLNEDLYKYRFRSGSTVTSSLGKNLLDHPNVQLMLLEEVMQRKEVYAEYKDIFEIYFLWSFYCETISYSYEYNSRIPYEYFMGMQKICNDVFPDWNRNKYLSMVPKGGIEILKTLNASFESQDVLDSTIIRIGGLI